MSNRIPSKFENNLTRNWAVQELWGNVSMYFVQASIRSESGIEEKSSRTTSHRPYQHSIRKYQKRTEVNKQLLRGNISRSTFSQSQENYSAIALASSNVSPLWTSLGNSSNNTYYAGLDSRTSAFLQPNETYPKEILKPSFLKRQYHHLEQRDRWLLFPCELFSDEIISISVGKLGSGTRTCVLPTKPWFRHNNLYVRVPNLGFS